MTRRLVSYGLRADDQARVDACVAEIAEITAATHHDGPLPEDAGDGGEALVLARFDPEAVAGSATAALWLADDARAAHAALSERDNDEEKSEAIILGSEDLTASGLRVAMVALDALASVQSALRDAQTRFEARTEQFGLARFVVENSRAVLFRWLPRAGSPLAYVSQNVSIFGYNAAQLLEQRTFYQTLVHADDLEQALRQLSEAERSGATQVEMEYRLLTAEGESRWVRDSTYIERDEDGQPRFRQGIVHDVTEQRVARDALLRFSHAVEQSPTSILIADTRGRIEYANRHFTALSGFTTEDVVGEKLLSFNATDDSEEGKSYWQAVWGGREWRGELRKRRKDGAHYVERVHSMPIRDAKGTVAHVLEIGEDITEQKENEEVIRRMAYFDPLTSLPNRARFNERARAALTRARRDDRALAVLFLDLDGFKNVNDTLGHSTGDMLLKEVASRLVDSVRDDDTVARMGGDEFLIMLPSLDRPSDAQRVAQKIIDKCRAPFDLDGHEVRVSVSIGIAAFPDDGDNEETLVRHADAAMYRAKESGKNTLLSYSPFTSDASARRQALGELISDALEQDEFALYYQPQFTLAEGRIDACEALVRWRHPERGLLMPPDFLPLAEDIGLLPPIGRWVLETALRDALRWPGEPARRVAVNVSASEALRREFVPTVAALLEQVEFPPERLQLEFHSDVLKADPDATRVTFDALNDLGIQLAVDDVDLRTWPLPDLAGLPVRSVKINRQLMQRAMEHETERAYFRALLALCDSMGVQSVAEGVDTPDQLAFLEAHRCDAALGFSFCLPLPLDEASRLLDTHDPEEFLRQRERRFR